MSLRIEDLNVGDKGFLFVKDGASKDGKEFTAEIMAIRDTNVNPIKDARKQGIDRSRFLIQFKIEKPGEVGYKSFYCNVIHAFVKGWGTVETYVPKDGE